MPRRIKDEKILLERVVKMLPKGIPSSAIESVEYDPWGGYETTDSYWVYLNDGWICGDTECHTIHEDNLRDLASAVSTVARWDDDPDLIYHLGYTEYKD